MKKFENIYIASDVDGTFLHKNAIERNLEKINYFTENGGHFAFATGRNIYETDGAIPYWRRICNLPCALCNGSMLYDAENEQIINPQYLLPEEKAADILRTINERFSDFVSVRATTPNGYVFCEEDAITMKNFTANGCIKISTVVPRDRLDGKNYFKIVAEMSDDLLWGVLEELNKTYSDTFVLTRSAPRLIEILPKGISKAFQINYLKEKIKKENPDACFWCIGDFDNDVDMLLSADVAVCPENATDRIKSIAKIITCNCRDGAVAEMIEKIEETL